MERTNDRVTLQIVAAFHIQAVLGHQDVARIQGSITQISIIINVLNEPKNQEMNKTGEINDKLMLILVKNHDCV
jgi:hypothetical protein